jgi:vitamin B12 transporter
LNHHAKENSVIRFLLSASILTLFAPVAYAADAPENDVIIVTANGTNTPQSETGEAISVIDQAQLEQSQTTAISDILRTVPGVAVTRQGGVGAQTSVFIRGGESSQTLVLIDGVRINDPSSPNAAYDFGALLSGNIKNVEVLRGPNSVVWGSQAMGGVINVQTATPTDALTVRAHAEAGSLNTYQGSAKIAGTSGVLSGSFGAGYYSTDGISAVKAGNEADGYRNFSANARLSIALGNESSVDFRSYYTRGKVEFDDPFGATPDTFPVTDNKQFIGYVGFNNQLLDGRIRNRISYSRAQITRIGTEPNVAFSFNENSLKGAVDRFEYRGSFDPIKSVSLVAGVEHERTMASTFFPAGGAAADVASTQVTSGYGQLILRPIAGLTVTGGVRHDGYSDYGGKTTFGANFTYSPNEGATILRGTYAEGFRAPTLTEALLPYGNTALKPETAKSYDVGVEQKLIGNAVVATATYFNRTSNDAIVYSFVTYQSENIARTKATGAEFSLDIRPSHTFAINAQFSLVDARDKSPGATFDNRLARRASNTASVSANWQASFGVNWGGDIILVGDSFDDRGNNDRLDGYVLANIRVSVPITEMIEVYGRVENLGDVDYAVVKGYSVLGRIFNAGIRMKL